MSQAIQTNDIKNEIKNTNNNKGAGFTLNTDKSLWNVEKGGFIVTVTFENVDELTMENINKMYDKYDDIISTYKDTVKIGAFNLENDNGVDIDLNIRLEDKEKAIKLGKQFNQESIFNANNFECIELNSRSENSQITTENEIVEVIENV